MRIQYQGNFEVQYNFLAHIRFILKMSKIATMRQEDDYLLRNRPLRNGGRTPLMFTVG